MVRIGNSACFIGGLDFSRPKAGYSSTIRNGVDSIAVGLATNIPPHNLNETIDAVVALIDDPEIDIDTLMDHIKGPDFPTGGIIMGTMGIREAYLTGRGRVIVRGKTEIEHIKNITEAIS